MKANLNRPMTTSEATDKHQCDQCRQGGDCGWNCVESSTCSLNCRFCGERNWFTGDLPEKPWVFICKTCGKETKK